MKIIKNRFYIFQIFLVSYYYLNFYKFISGQSIWYDDAHELLISKINILSINDLIMIADYHIGFSLILLLVTYFTNLQNVYFVISIIFCVCFVATGILIGNKLGSKDSVVIAQFLLLSSPTLIQYSFRPKHFVFEFLIILCLSVVLHQSRNTMKILFLSIPVVLFSSVSIIYFIYPLLKNIRKNFKIANLLYISFLFLFVLERGSRKLFSEKFREYWELDSSNLFEGIETLFFNNLLFIRSFNDSGYLVLLILVIIVGAFRLFIQNRDIFLFTFIPTLLLNLLSTINLYPIGKGRTDLILFPIIFFSIYYFAKLCFEKFKLKIPIFVFLILLIAFLPMKIEQKIDNTNLILSSTNFSNYDKVFVSYYSIPQFILMTDELSEVKADPTGENCIYKTISAKIVFLQTPTNFSKEGPQKDSCTPITNLNLIEESLRSNKKVLIMGHDSKTQNILNFVESKEFLLKNFKITKYGKDEILMESLNE